MTTTTVGTGSARTTPPLWLVLVAGSIITALSLGVRSTFGLFLDPVIDTLGTGRGVFALAVAIQNLVWGLSQPIAGAIADRFGSARVLATGAVIYAIGMVLMSTADSSGALYLSAGFIVGAGTGAASFAVVLAALGRIAPPEKRSMALGIATAMGSVGQFVLVPLVQRLIDNGGWETAAVILGGVILSVMIFAPGLRGRSADQAPPQDSGEAEVVRPLSTELRRAGASNSYRMLNLAFFVCGFHVTFIATHLTSYAEDVGQTREVAATALALIGLFNIAGSLTAGALGGRYSKSKLLTVIYAGRAVVLAGFVLLPASRTSTIVFGALIGLLWLSTVPLTSGIVVSQFGTTHSGTLFGIVFLSHQVGAFAGAWMGGSLADSAGSYDPVWWIAVGLGVLAALLHLMIDEGPQPEAPPTGRLAAAPLGGTAVLALLVGVGSILSVGKSTEADASTAEVATADQVGRDGRVNTIDRAEADGDHGVFGVLRTGALFCPLHPVDVSDR
ncbi:MAG: MFS transporter [Actinomycetota bacterium]